MEKLKILIIVMFLGLGAYSQTVPGYTTIRARYKWIGGGFDSVLVVPAYNTTPSGLRSQYARAGQLAYDSVNNKLYIYDGGWSLVMDTANKWITSIYRKTASDSVFYVKGGTHTFAFDSTGGSTPTLQQVLATQSNNAVVTTTTDISPDSDTRDLFFGNAQKWGEIKILSKDTTRFVSDIVLVDTSDFWVKGDSITNLFRVRTDINKIGLGTDNPYSFISNLTTQMTDGSNGVSSDGIQFSMSNGGYMGGFENTSSGGTAFGVLIKSNGNERILNVINSSAVSVLRADKDSLISNLTIAAGDSTNKIPTTKWVKQEIASGGGGSDSSYIFFDTTYNRLGTVVSTDTSIVKSLRIQVNGSTVTPTVTDSTINWDLTSLVTSLTNGLTLSSGVGKLGGALTETTNITNASGYSFKLHLDEDDSDVGFIGDTYNSLIGFQNGNIVLSQNGGTTVATVTSTYSSFQAASGGYNTEFLVYRDKVQVNPHLGAFYIDTLTSAVGTKALRYNPTTGLVSYADTTTGGGGLEKGVTTIASSATRRILYDSSGILQNNGKFLLNANDELQINNETDEGDFKLQVKGNGFFQAASGSGTSYVYFESTTGTNHAIQYDGTQMFIKGASTLILGDQGTGSVLQVYNQKVYIAPGGGTGSARLEIGAGTTSVSPLAFTTGPVKTTPQAGAFDYTTPQLFFTNGTATRQEIPLIQQSRVSTQFDKTNTTLANITGLTANVAAGATYRFEAILYTTSDVAGGVKVAIAGTSTATSVIYEALVTDAGLITQGRSTAMGTAVGSVTAVTAACIKITGTITVNAAGTLTVQFAENAATGTSSVLVGSTFVVTQIL